jgi:hypothetical protein
MKKYENFSSNLEGTYNWYIYTRRKNALPCQAAMLLIKRKNDKINGLLTVFYKRPRKRVQYNTNFLV